MRKRFLIENKVICKYLHAFSLSQIPENIDKSGFKR